jgi:hypothetical protein
MQPQQLSSPIDRIIHIGSSLLCDLYHDDQHSYGWASSIRVEMQELAVCDLVGLFVYWHDYTDYVVDSVFNFAAKLFGSNLNSSIVFDSAFELAVKSLIGSYLGSIIFYSKLKLAGKSIIDFCLDLIFFDSNLELVSPIVDSSLGLIFSSGLKLANRSIICSHLGSNIFFNSSFKLAVECIVRSYLYIPNNFDSNFQLAIQSCIVFFDSSF